MGTYEIVMAVVGLLASLLCCGGCFLLFLVMLGFILLRRRGKTDVSVSEAMSAGAESVSQVFVRGKGGLETWNDDEEEEG